MISFLVESNIKVNFFVTNLTLHLRSPFTTTPIIKVAVVYVVFYYTLNCIIVFEQFAIVNVYSLEPNRMHKHHV
uniref:G-protein coupled receptors family 1 profile domain-containing protein n=1 Tax=Octopus bimaculoides TaxID=37653 RepID=A0A0L8FT55_OCTBM